MPIFLSKLLPMFIYPLGLACLLILLVLTVIKRWSIQRALLILAFLLLWLAGTNWVAMGLARSLEWRYFPPDPLPEADVIVLLSGGTQPADHPRSLVEVTGAGDRVLYTAWMYNQGVADGILISGGSIGWNPGVESPAHQAGALLEFLEVPTSAVTYESDSRNTYESAVNSAILLHEQGMERIYLVTSAAHMPRSVRLFEAQGIEVVPLPTDYIVTEAGWQALWDGSLEAQILGLVPSASNLAITTSMMKEYIGTGIYSLKGWK